MSDRIRRVRVLIEREDGRVVAWEFVGPDLAATMHSHGSWDRTTGQQKVDHGMRITSSRPPARLVPGQPAITDITILEGEVL